MICVYMECKYVYTWSVKNPTIPSDILKTNETIFEIVNQVHFALVCKLLLTFANFHLNAPLELIVE